MAGRYDVLKRVLQLDPKEDCQEITYLVGAYEYPWLIKKSLEFALFRTYAVPHTSRVLAATGQFESHGQKRYDDTSLMLAGLAEKGYDSDFGKTVIGTMNRLHGRWNLRNEDMLYVLSTFVFEPIRWHEKYGWRKPTDHEKDANFHFWREVGIRMHIEDIPETREAYEAFNIAHEKKYYAYDKANRAIGEATISVFLSWYPSFLHPIIRQGLLAFMDDPLLEAMGFEKPHGSIRWVADKGLKLVGFAMRFMPPRTKPFLYTEVPSRTYGDSFTPEELGAKEEENKTNAPISS
ncbi:MAG: oxygenase MpaB family protein [Chloroflexota bacterium]